MTTKQITGWSTQNALTTGAEAVTLDDDSEVREKTYPAENMEPSPYGHNLRKYVYIGGCGHRQLVPGKNFFLTRDEALEDVKRRATAKLKSLEKQRKKLIELAQYGEKLDSL